MEEQDDKPPPVYTEEEREALCRTCGTLVLSRDTHKAGALHHERAEQAKKALAAAADCSVSFGRPPSTGPRSELEEAATRVLLATRPDLLTAAARGLVTGAPLERSEDQGPAVGQRAFSAPPPSAPDPAPWRLCPPSVTPGLSTLAASAVARGDSPGHVLEPPSLVPDSPSEIEMEDLEQAAERLLSGAADEA